MNSIVLALALLAGASADSAKSAAYATSGTCEGNPAVYSYSVIGCESFSAGTSYKIQCENATSAKLLSYSDTTDCNGEPSSTQDYPLVFGCAAQNTTSSMMSCSSGEFVAPKPAGNIYTYNTPYFDSCPPSGGDLTAVISYPCGTCIDYGSGMYGMYSCDRANVHSDYYETPDCSGASIYSVPLDTVGCTATSTQVIMVSCDKRDTKVPPSTPAMEIAGALEARGAVLAMVEKAAAAAKAAAAIRA